MYYPKSQVKTGLYTNGNEYALITTQKEYVGYYFETSSGKKYTGKKKRVCWDMWMTVTVDTSDKLPSIIITAPGAVHCSNGPTSISSNQGFFFFFIA